MTDPSRSPCSLRQCLYRPANKKVLNALETQLCFLRDECATICVIYDSLRNVYQTQLMLSRVPERHRELLLDYDDLTLKVQQLERKVENLEVEFKSALKGTLVAQQQRQPQYEQRLSHRRFHSQIEESFNSPNKRLKPVPRNSA